MIEVKVQDRIYQVREDIGTAGALEWISRYWIEPDPDTPVDTLVDIGLCSVAETLADAPFLIERLVKVNGKPVKPDDVPLWHIPELIRPMRDALHLTEFIDAMTARVKAAMDDDAPEPETETDGTEKN